MGEGRKGGGGVSRDGSDVGRGSHLGEDFVQPHEWAVEMDLDPARGARHVLTMVLCAPALHEAHPNGAHLCELVYGLEALVDGERQELGKLLVVEDLEGAAGRDLTDGGRVERVGVVALPALDKDGVVTQALGENFPAHVEQVDSLPDVASHVLDGRVTVHVGEEPETEAVGGGGGIGEAIHDHVAAGGVEGLPHTLVEFIVGHRAPVGRLLVLDGHHSRREHCLGGRRRDGLVYARDCRGERLDGVRGGGGGEEREVGEGGRGRGGEGKRGRGGDEMGRQRWGVVWEGHEIKMAGRGKSGRKRRRKYTIQVLCTGNTLQNTSH